MEQKIIPEYEYLGLGFPILLKDVVFLKIHEQWHPKIDVEKVADEAFHDLIEKSSTLPLTRNEMKFIRTYLDINQVDQNLLDITHSRIIEQEVLDLIDEP